MEMIVYSRANKTYFHKKGCALGVVSKVRVLGTRKWPLKNNNGDGQTQNVKRYMTDRRCSRIVGPLGGSYVLRRVHIIFIQDGFELSALKVALKLKVLLIAVLFYHQRGEFLRSPFFFPQILRYV